MSVKNRLISFIQSQDLTVREFEKSISASNGYVNSISRSVGIDKVMMMIEKYPNVNIDWLMTGRGDMFLKFNDKAEQQEKKILEGLMGEFESYEELSIKYRKLLEEYNEVLKDRLVALIRRKDDLS